LHGTVLSWSGQSYVVDLERRRCTCGEFQNHGVPCAHAMSFLREIGSAPRDWVPYNLTLEAYRRVYETNLPPIDISNLLKRNERDDAAFPPNTVRKKPGRPQTKRKEAGAQGPRGQTCGNCGIRGHKTSTCQRLPRAVHQVGVEPEGLGPIGGGQGA
jgi:hypothetical protein